jgi:hypothetical protein
VTDDSRLLPNELSAGEDGEVGDAAHSESSGKLLMLVGVDFEHDGLTSHILCGACDLGCRGVARAAPLCPEIDKDGNPRALENLIEECSVNLQGFVLWRQWGFACTAPAGVVRKMARCDPVLLATVLARSYCGHLVAPLDWIHLAGFGCRLQPRLKPTGA